MQVVVMKPFQMGNNPDKVPVGTVLDSVVLGNARALLNQRYVEPCYTSEGETAGGQVLSEVQMDNLANRVLRKIAAGELEISAAQATIVITAVVEQLATSDLLGALVQESCQREITAQISQLAQPGQKGGRKKR